MTARCIESQSVDPYTNLAIESCLMSCVRPGAPVLYLWQNERTVVIGRNQYASAECNLERLELDGGHLARRRSGGGAVYHDLGNLNFTFVTVPDEYDQVAQTDVILNAVRALGIAAERTGRNDLVLESGGKFSGHAYQHTKVASCHHGTIMVSVDVEALGRYLTVSPLKLRAKGVRSVRSRVVNLRSVKPDITIAQLKAALLAAFEDAVGCHVAVEDARMALDAAQVEAERQLFSTRAWLFRGERNFDQSLEARFDWGQVRVGLSCSDGVIRDISIFSDGLDTEALDAAPALLTGARIDAAELESRLSAGGLPSYMAADLAHLVAEQA